MSKPTTKPVWAKNLVNNGPAGGDNKVEPTEALKDRGLDYPSYLEREHFNYIAGSTSEWVDHLERVTDYSDLHGFSLDLEKSINGDIVVKPGVYKTSLGNFEATGTHPFVSPVGLYMSPLGDKLYVLCDTNNTIYEYDLITTGKLNKAEYTGKSFDLSNEDTEAKDISFKEDGTTFFVAGATGNSIYQYSLSTAWDISTASYSSYSHSIASEDTNIKGLHFSPAGTQMYIVGASSTSIHEYSIAVAWDLSSTILLTDSHSVSSEEASPTGLTLARDGLTLLLSGTTSGDVFQYSLGSAFDLTTLSYEDTSSKAHDSNIQAVIFGLDDNTFLQAGTSVGNVTQSSVSEQGSLTGLISQAYVDVSSISTDLLGVTLSKDGNHAYLVADSTVAYQLDLAVPYDITTATDASLSFDFVAQIPSSFQALNIKEDGTKVYASDFSTIYQYTLSTPYDISTASYDSVSFARGAESSNWGACKFLEDGSGFHTIEIFGGTTLNFYNLPTAWDISTAVFSGDSIEIGTGGHSNDFTFFNHGKSLFLEYATGHYIYTMDKPYDLSSAEFTNRTDAVGPFNFTYLDSPDQLYAINNSLDRIYQYDAFSPGTAKVNLPKQSTTLSVGKNRDNVKISIDTSTGAVKEASEFLSAYEVVLWEASTGSSDLLEYKDLRYITPINDVIDVKSGRRNKIVDGGFTRWDEGTSQTSNGYGSDTMWLNLNSGTTKTHSRQEFTLGQTDVPGNPRYFSRTVVSSVAGAGNYCVKQQRIEKAETFSGGTATLSFWAKADSSKNIAIDLKQIFGSGGTPSSSVDGIGAQKIAITSSWVRYAVTLDIPSVIGKSLGTDGNNNLEVSFWFDAGSNWNSRTDSLGQQSGTFDLYGVQLEEGTVATKFEDLLQSEIDDQVDYFYRNSYPDGYYPGDDTTAAGQAGMYYLKFDTSTSITRANFPYAAGMHSASTITLYEPTGSAANSILVNGSSSSATSRWVSARSASVGWTNSGYDIQFHWEADARL